MPRETLNVQMVFDTLTCERSDDWWDASEPYLWVVFFTIDGTTVRVLPTTRLSGTGSIASSNGSHGNLGVGGMDTGDVVSIPSTIGVFETRLVPIPVDPPLSGTTPDASGVVGAAVVLWEEDDFPGPTPDIGYDEFADSVWWAVQQIIAARSLASMEPTPAELAALTEAVQADVRRVIERYLRGRVWIGNPDDQIGFELFRFSHDSFSTAAVQPFTTRWSGSDGDWVLSGTITGVPPCPVRALLAALGGRAGELPSPDDAQGVMRAFRDAAFAGNPRLAEWWSTLEDLSAVLADGVHRSPELQELALELFRDARGLLDDAGRRIDGGVVQRAETVLRRLGELSPRARRRLSALRPVVARMEGKTLAELAAHIGQPGAQ